MVKADREKKCSGEPSGQSSPSEAFVKPLPYPRKFRQFPVINDFYQHRLHNCLLLPSLFKFLSTALSLDPLCSLSSILPFPISSSFIIWFFPHPWKSQTLHFHQLKKKNPLSPSPYPVFTPWLTRYLPFPTDPRQHLPTRRGPPPRLGQYRGGGRSRWPSVTRLVTPQPDKSPPTAPDIPVIPVGATHLSCTPVILTSWRQTPSFVKQTSNGVWQRNMNIIS